MDTLRHIASRMESRLEDLRRQRQGGRPVIGYVPGGYFPEELALAAGALPVCMIRGGDHSPVEASSAVIDRWLDTFYRAQIGYALSGTDPWYTMADALVIPVTDSNNRALCDMLTLHTDLNILSFGVPHVQDEAGRDYYLHGIQGLRDRFESMTGTALTDDNLREAISLCNAERRLFTRIRQMRRSDPPPLNGSDFVMLNHASMILDKPVMIDALEGLIQELEESRPTGNGRPRFLLTGSTLAWGDEKMPRLIEEAGGSVVVEEFAEGVRPFGEDVAESADDPLAALADAYFLKRIAPAWFRPATERIDHLVSLARDFSVDGVIRYQLLYRDAYTIESTLLAERLMKETGLPLLLLESDYDPSETGQLRTRIETCVETTGRFG